MITVDYQFIKDGRWIKGSKEFLDVYLAKRFILSLRRKQNYLFLGYRCDDPEDSQFLSETL